VEPRRIGDLARASGVTVRTLHHYEDIGLLCPARSDAGHRLYGDADVERLYVIIQMRHLGLSLGEIGRALDDECDVADVMRRQLAELDRRLDATNRLRNRLVSLLSSTPPGTDDLLAFLEEATMLDAAPQRRIGILVYSDLEAAFNHLVEVFGLGPGELTRTSEGNAGHAELEAGDGVLWLHPESPEFGLASPKRAGVSTAMIAVMVDDVDAHFRHASSRGADIVFEPVDQPYGYREYGARDNEGGLWSFMKPLGDVPSSY
jgi:MerR family transcriptional regulator, thiopeptide resistance regulator